MEKLRRYELIHGECIEEMKKLKDKSIDLILCDLPYGTTDCSWDKIIDFNLLWEQYHRIIKDNGAIVLFSAQPFTTKLINSNLKNYKYSWYWIKNKCTVFTFAKHQPMRKVEDINVFYKKKPLYVPQGLIKLDKPKLKKRKPKKQNSDDIYKTSTLLKEHIIEYTNYPKNVLYFDKETKNVHPTQKPNDLLEYLIKTYTREGDLILDNCMGSGSCGVAAAKNKRRFIGIELSKDYFEIAKDRIERAYKEV
ncbi:DNA modification methylase,Modification methylase DpnIIB,putative methyltransferase,Adenine specific DNA methylase Mod,DNA methylase [[Clostridium] sordellii]|uniref:DNA-methyltransferase n=1 Tax=Paraclostridium sordellii TaxID=1505 RepID=UPI0005423919|nr:site-specific DNA-methyltransferase [Paeniclostridium sordellii]CEK34374.1 DNA modification methylase,Modification methylase DpnIIB,putative methyltransferase,Adenine specific DNA methylase Mod,DNA methylase [[Clostridium] sordellii] [Paeniclostridium sordellii]